MRADLLIAAGAALAAVVALPGAAARDGQVARAARATRPAFARPAIDSISLEPTSDARGASGVAVLTRSQSPFGMSLTPDGHLRYDVHLHVTGLPADPHVYDGATAYVAWATVPDLSLARRLGPVAADGSSSGEVDWNKFIVIVTAEKAATTTAAAPHWSGTILLKGVSPSTWMQRYGSHILNNGGNPQW